MQWGKKELIVAANKKRVEVTVIPAILNKTIDLSGLTEKEKANKVAETIAELQNEFIKQIHGLIGEVKPPKKEEPIKTEEPKEPIAPKEEKKPEAPLAELPTVETKEEEAPKPPKVIPTGTEVKPT